MVIFERVVSSVQFVVDQERSLPAPTQSANWTACHGIRKQDLSAFPVLILTEHHQILPQGLCGQRQPVEVKGGICRGAWYCLQSGQAAVDVCAGWWWCSCDSSSSVFA